MPISEWVSWGRVDSVTMSKDGLEPGVEYAIQVRAVSENGVLGDWSDEIALTVERDVTPPPQPAAPVGVSSMGVITLSWNGLAVDGSGMGADFVRCRVYREGVAPAIDIMTNRDTPASIIVTNLPLGSQQRFRLEPVDRSGNVGVASAWSNYITVLSVLDDPNIAQGIEDIAIEAAGGVSGNKNNYSLSNPPTTGNETRLDGDKWIKLDATGRVVGQWHWDAASAAWVSETITDALISNLDAGKITTGTLSAARLAAGAITADKLSAGAIDGKTITGVTINAGTLATGTRTSTTAGQGFYVASNGHTTLRSATAPVITMNPADGTILIGTPGAGRAHFDATGRFRIYRTDNSLAVDINPGVLVGTVSLDARVNVGALYTEAVGGGGVYTNYIYSPSGYGHLYLMTAGTARVSLEPGGNVHSSKIGGAVLTHSSTTGVYIRTDNGQMGISGSSRRFKVNIQEHTVTGDLLSLSPARWNDRGQCEQYADALARKAAGEEVPEEELADITLEPGYGLIAEEVVDAGLGEFVVFERDGVTPRLVTYDRLWVALIPIVRGLRDRISQLESRLENQ